MKHNWKTLMRTNAEHNDHSWTIRIVGNDEVKYFKQLVSFLDTNKFVYRVINSSRRQTNYCRKWYIDSTLLSDAAYIPGSETYPAGLHWEREGYVIHVYTGEIIAYRGDIIRIQVYKRTTQLDYVDRKEVN